VLDMAFPPSFFPPLWAYEVCLFVRLKGAIASNRSLTINYQQRQPDTQRIFRAQRSGVFTNCSSCSNERVVAWQWMGFGHYAAKRSNRGSNAVTPSQVTAHAAKQNA
jgi:hypothetical protein